MKLSFIINKYLLMWYLLYQTSINEEIHKLKQKLWIDHKKQYSFLHGEKDNILNELDNYIPDDDVIFSLFEDSDIYKRIRTETNRYRLSLLEIWDLNRKNYFKELSNILKKDFNETYKVLVIHPSLNIIEVTDDLIIIGKKITNRDKDNFLTYLFYKILKQKFNLLKYEDRDIINVILELITINELYTRITNESKYNYGKKELYELKKQIYPYWLMYLGIKEDKIDSYMIRDNFFFNKSDYKYDDTLEDMDIYDFIGFCIRHKRKIFNSKTVTVEEIEII